MWIYRIEISRGNEVKERIELLLLIVPNRTTTVLPCIQSGSSVISCISEF